MKIRNGFISNSSSSSFIINKKDITEQQADYIRRHKEISNMDEFPTIVNQTRSVCYEDDDIIVIKKQQEEPQYEYDDYDRKDWENQCGKHDAWSISEDEDIIEGYTTMDNFDMRHFLQRIGVNKAVFRD